MFSERSLKFTFSLLLTKIYNQGVTKTNFFQNGSFKITAFAPHRETIGHVHTKQVKNKKQSNNDTYTTNTRPYVPTGAKRNDDDDDTTNTNKRIMRF